PVQRRQAALQVFADLIKRYLVDLGNHAAQLFLKLVEAAGHSGYGKRIRLEIYLGGLDVLHEIERNVLLAGQQVSRLDLRPKSMLDKRTQQVRCRITVGLLLV